MRQQGKAANLPDRRVADQRRIGAQPAEGAVVRPIIRGDVHPGEGCVAGHVNGRRRRGHRGRRRGRRGFGLGGDDGVAGLVEAREVAAEGGVGFSLEQLADRFAGGQAALEGVVNDGDVREVGLPRAGWISMLLLEWLRKQCNHPAQGLTGPSK